jgi:hypothetical protein
LPDWASGKVRDYSEGNYGSAGPMHDYASSIAKLMDAPNLIEELRLLQNTQYQRDIADPTRRAINSAISSAYGRGTRSSSMAAREQEGIAGRLAQAGQQAQNQSNVWAAGANLANLDKIVSANKDFATLIAGLLAASKESWSIKPNNLGLSPAGVNNAVNPTQYSGTSNLSNGPSQTNYIQGQPANGPAGAPATTPATPPATPPTTTPSQYNGRRPNTYMNYNGTPAWWQV